MYERFTERARKVMQLANQEAQRFDHEYIGTEHILLGLVKEGAGVAAEVLKSLDIDLRKTRLEIEKMVQSGPDVVTQYTLPQTPRAKKVIEYAAEEARNLNHNYIGTEHLLLGLLREEEGVAAQVLMNLGLKLEDVRAEVLNLLGHDIRSLPGETRVPVPGPKETSTLDRFCLDLTQQAKDGKLGPIVGRREEMEHLLMVLGCRSQNNPILVGPPGVGKSAIVKGLAIRSASDDWPEIFRNRRILAFNLTHMIGTTLQHRNFAESFEAFIKEIRNAHKPVILFIDDLHTLTGVGTTRSIQYAFCALRSGLARGEFQCITLATPEGYQSEVVPDAILSRHLQPIFVKPLSAEETLKVLRAKRDVYESHHRAELTEDALMAAIELSQLHWPDHCLPGKALSVLDQAGALVRLRITAPPPDLKELETKIDTLNQQKEEAVAEQDFQRASDLRDQADKLKKQRDARLQEWNRQVFVKTGKVDKETVAEVVRKMGGDRGA